MIVVSDSTPLITLMKAGQLDVLCKLFGDVLIPQAVYSELTRNENFPEETKQIQNSEFLKVVTVEDEKAVSLLQRATGLDRGESEAIVYADTIHSDFLLMDEVPGRRVASGMGLEIMGSIGVLVNGFREGFISESDVEMSFNRIRNTNRHISERLLQDSLDIIRQEARNMNTEN